MPNLWIDEKTEEPTPLRYARTILDVLGMLFAGAAILLVGMMILFMAFTD